MLESQGGNVKKNSKISKEIVRTLVLVGEDHDSQRRGGDVVLGVAWYDEKFFKENQKSFSNPLHLEKYKDIGLKKGAIIVTHWKFLGEGLV